MKKEIAYMLVTCTVCLIGSFFYTNKVTEKLEKRIEELEKKK